LQGKLNPKDKIFSF